MVRPIHVRSRQDLEKLARELEKQFTVVFTDDDHLVAMRDGVIVKRFAVLSKGTKIEPAGLNKVAALPSNGHVLLMYDDASNGRSLEYRFLVDGLSKGERCVYATHIDTRQIEQDMVENGIPVDDFKAKNLLRVHKIEDPFQDADKWSTNVRRIIERIMTDKPDRIVSWRWIRDIDGGKQNLVNRQVEQMVNAAIRGDVIDPNYWGIKNFSGLFVCTYLVRGITHNEHLAWLTNHLANHDTAIFAGGEERAFLMNQNGRG